jgi:hypothetical protein
LDVEPFLQQDVRWALQLASLPRERGSAAPAEKTLFESIRRPDIGLYAAADKRVLEHVIDGLKWGNPAVKRSAAAALGGLGANLPANLAPCGRCAAERTQ